MRLILLWIAVAAACGVAAYLMWQLAQISLSAQIDRADAILSRSCSNIAERYRFYASDWGGTEDLRSAGLQRDLLAVIDLALRNEPGVEGGIWQNEAGSLAYGYPTYEGGGVKTDIPAAELDRIQAVNRRAARDDEPREARFNGPSQTLLLRACPLPGPVSGLTAWTMTRVFHAAWAGYGKLRIGLILLFGCVAIAAVLGTRILMVWSRHIHGIERTLEAGGLDLPPLQMTGERELDRIIAALNHAGEHLTEARQEKERLNRQVAAADRLAAIGRLAAAFAHEIRNPIAAMRLKAENALADDTRQREALRAIIEQVDRLDRLVGQMLSASSAQLAKPVSMPMPQFLEETVSPYRDLAAAKGVAFDVQTGIDQARLDPGLTRRALENLITNAVEHSSAGGKVRLAARHGGGRLVIAVEDKGTGIAPELAETLFEPFVSGRSNGTGLGLAIAREAVASQGGTLRLVPSERGATFEIELPG